MNFDPHQPLRDDVRLLGEVLGRVLRHHEGEEIFHRVEQVREAAKRARTRDSELEHIDQLLRDMPITSALTVARAFAHFLTLANIAEQHHRVHRRRDHARDPEGQPQRGSAAETLARLRQAGVSADALSAALASMRVELVFTAHPTEIVRRTLLQKHNRIAQILAFRDRPDLTPDELADSLADLQREIAAAWQTDEVRRSRVTPLDEVRAGLVVFEQSLWDALPQYLRAVDRALAAATGTQLTRDVSPVRFGSWIGGDRDGNPSITPEVTRQATWLARWQAADLYLKDINSLRSELSLSAAHASDELRARVGDAHEPYRVLLKEVRDRLDGDARPGRRGACGIGAEADGHRAIPRRGRACGAAGAVLSFAGGDRQRGDRRRPPHRHPSPRDGLRRDARAPGSPPGGRAPYGRR